MKYENTPCGGLSKKCRIVVELPRRSRVVVTGVDTDIFAAITRTASRAKFAVRRHVFGPRSGRTCVPTPSVATRNS